MSSSTRKARDQLDGETAVPLLALGSRVDLDDSADTYDVEDESFTQRSRQPYKGRNDEFRGSNFKRRTPLPLLQLLVLSATRLAEPIAYTQIFPFVNQMMEDLKVTDKPSEIGYYSGVVDSIFAVCQLFTILQWGRLSDRIGRKPVILLGLTGVTISTLLFGISQTFWWAVISRSLAGALSGNTAVVQSVVGEITDETNQGLAFPLTGLSWSLGCIIGPMIGGNFVNPEKYYPNTFGKIQLLRDYPYLLPCILSSLLTLCSIICGAVFLKETLPSKVQLDVRLPSPISAHRNEKLSSPPKVDTSIRMIMSSPSIKSVFRNYFLLSVSGTAFDVVFILMAYSPVAIGGLARSPDEIGYALAFSGVCGSVFQVSVFPYLQRHYNNIKLYRVLMLLWPILFAILPFLGVLARWSAPPEALVANATVSATVGVIGESVSSSVVTYPGGKLLWFGIGLCLAILRLGHMCYALNTILIKNAAPSQEALGSTFGLAQTVACVARASSPAFVSTLFAMSKKYNLLHGNLVWVVMFAIAVAGFWSTMHIRDASVEKSYQRLQNPQTVEESEMRMM